MLRVLSNSYESVENVGSSNVQLGVAYMKYVWNFRRKEFTRVQYEGVQSIGLVLQQLIDSSWINVFKIILETYLCHADPGSRGGSAAARLLGLRVGNPPGAWMSVSCECCVCQVEVSATGRSLVQRSPTECGVSECDLETSTMRSLGPLGLSSHKKIIVAFGSLCGGNWC